MHELLPDVPRQLSRFRRSMARFGSFALGGPLSVVSPERRGFPVRVDDCFRPVKHGIVRTGSELTVVVKPTQARHITRHCTGPSPAAPAGECQCVSWLSRRT